MSMFGRDYAAKASPTGADKVLILDVADTSMSARGSEKTATLAALTALSVQLDSTAADIQPLGAISAGTSGLAARADHVHAAPVPQPSDLGVIAWSMDPAGAGAGSGALTTGQVYLAAFWIRKTVTLSNMAVAINTAGATLTSGQNFAAVFNASGTQVAVTADQTAAWGGGVGTYDMAFTSAFSAAPGMYWAALLANGTTAPNFRGTNPAISLTQVGQTAAQSRFGRILTGQTTMPGSITPSSITQTSAIAFCAVLH